MIYSLTHLILNIRIVFSSLAELLLHPIPTSILCSSVTGIIIGLFIKFEVEEFLIYLLMIGLLCSLLIAVFLHSGRLSLDKLKIENVIIISTINYLLESQRRRERFNDYNILNVDSVHFKHCFDIPRESDGKYLETFCWSVKGRGRSIEPVCEIRQHTLTLLENGFGTAEIMYEFEMASRNCTVEPKILTPSIYAVVSIDLTGHGFPVIHKDKPFAYSLTRTDVNDSYDVFGVFYVIDPLNFATSVNRIVVSVVGYNVVYSKANVRVYRFNRSNITHRLYRTYSFSRNKDGCYECNFSFEDDEIQENIVYGYVILKG